MNNSKNKLGIKNILIGIIASLVMALIFYWGLRLDSSLASFINTTASEPVYFWSYIVLTLATIILFGITAAFFSYRIEQFGWLNFKKSKTSSSGTFGVITGLFASACPICGSTLLSAIGLTGCLAAFPLAGLELKILSLGLVGASLFFVKKDINKNECIDCLPTESADTTQLELNPETKPPKNQKNLVVPIAFIIFLLLIGWKFLSSDPLIAKYLPASAGAIISDDLTEQVIPSKGFQSKIKLGDSILKLVEAGAIDKKKFEELYSSRGGLPEELKNILEKSSNEEILLTRENAGYYLNLLWPLGLANFMEANKTSPVNGDSLFNFASTGGWTLGIASNGGEYFNKFKIVALTPEQEKIVLAVADNSYRPCCGNSAFFQDCNHGSALLGLIELGAAQGLSEKELFEEALAFNSFWFPQQYLSMATYFKEVKGIDWKNVDPKIALGKDFSTARGWSQNVDAKLKELNLVPQQKGGGG